MGELISCIKDIIVALAAIITGIVAIYGITSWRRELKGKANFEVARTLIKTVYKLRDELRYCRAPFISAYEFPPEYNNRLSNNTDKEKGEAWAYVYLKRWEPVGNSIQEFDTALLEAEALWGSDITEKATKLTEACRELRFAVEAGIDDKYSGGKNFKNRELTLKMRSRISANKSDDDALSTKINEAISDLESEIRPHLSRS